MSPRVQLVLGLFTVPQDAKYREVVRETWLNQTGVCYWQREPREGCSVYVAFVVGRSGMGERRKGENATMSPEEVERTHRERGMLVLDIEENMNSNKSPSWFGAAVEMFPWATHVGKIDMDTYPFLHKLVHRIDQGMGCSRSFGPYEVIGRPHNTWGSFAPACPYGCAQFTTPRFDGGYPVAPLGEGWKFLSGELYIFSMSLAQKMNWNWSFPCCEDSQVFVHVNRDVRALGECIVLRRLDSWFHRNSLTDESFANDMSA